MRQRKPLKQIFAHLFLIVAALINIFPILWILFASLKETNLVLKIPPEFLFRPTLRSYNYVLTERMGSSQINFFHNMRNSLLTAIISTIIVLLIGVLTAYPLARFDFRGRKPISFLIIMTRLLPPIAMAVPLFLLIMTLGLLDTILALVLAYTALNAPLAVWMIMGFLSRIPYEVEEAALIDGCSRFGVLTRVVLPLITPALVAIGFYSFIVAWNNFTMALVLTMREAVTLPVMVLSFLWDAQTSLGWGPVCAVAILIIIPPILFTFFFHKYMVKGLAAGGVKE